MPVAMASNKWSLVSLMCPHYFGEFRFVTSSEICICGHFLFHYWIYLYCMWYPSLYNVVGRRVEDLTVLLRIKLGFFAPISSSFLFWVFCKRRSFLYLLKTINPLQLHNILLLNYKYTFFGDLCSDREILNLANFVALII
jgi:hypothetical protein